MNSSEQYKRQIMNDLAQGNTESIDDAPKNSVQQYKNFDDFAQRSSHDERHQLFGRSLHPDKILASQMEPISNKLGLESKSQWVEIQDLPDWVAMRPWGSASVEEFLYG